MFKSRRNSYHCTFPSGGIGPIRSDEVDGQEYQRTLVDQGEVETYLQDYAVLLADRRVALINERVLLALKRYSRKTEAASELLMLLQRVN